MFAKAMSSITSYTWNGALSNASPDKENIYNGRLSLFFKTVRGITDIKLYEYLEKSASESLIDTYVLAFHIRDCRGGKGEREIGRKMLEWLFLNESRFIKSPKFNKVYNYIPEYGRFDDLLIFFPNVIKDLNVCKETQTNILNFCCEKLKEDKNLMELGKPVSLLAKWMPTENDSDDRKYKLVNTICSILDISPREYRKEFITPLRGYIKIVETKMCENRWDEIEFSKVPSCAMKKLKNAFKKHTPEEFQEWSRKLKTGETKVNAKQLYPHELIREIRTKGGSDEVITAQWNVLEDEVRKLACLQDTVVIVDTSSSMHTPNFLPFDIACAMGLIISAVVEGPFHNNVITFNSTPEFVEIRDGDIGDRFEQIRNIPWGGSTNLQKTFEMILEKGKAAGLTNKDMPKRIVLVSDMQFNRIEEYSDIPKTNFEIIEKMYENSNYTKPDIVFWNVNGSSEDFPVTMEDNGTCLISGASPSIIKAIIKTKELSSVSILRETLDDKRYQVVKDQLV
jgi:hypothetical protein